MTTKRPHFCLDGETWTLLLMWDREKRIIAPPYDNFLHIPFEWYIWNIYTNDYFTDRVVSYMLGGNKEFSRLQSNKLESTKSRGTYLVIWMHKHIDCCPIISHMNIWNIE